MRGVTIFATIFLLCKKGTWEAACNRTHIWLLQFSGNYMSSTPAGDWKFVLNFCKSTNTQCDDEEIVKGANFKSIQMHVSAPWCYALSSDISIDDSTVVPLSWSSQTSFFSPDFALTPLQKMLSSQILVCFSPTLVERRHQEGKFEKHISVFSVIRV